MHEFIFIKKETHEKDLISLQGRELIINKYCKNKISKEIYLDKMKKSFYLSEENIYWSLSYSDEYIVAVVGKKSIGIDIEKIKERDSSLLELLPKKTNKNWLFFYRFWTAKESIIKKNNLILADHSKIEYISHDTFSMFMKYNNKIFTCEQYKRGDYIISICL